VAIIFDHSSSHAVHFGESVVNRLSILPWNRKGQRDRTGNVVIDTGAVNSLRHNLIYWRRFILDRHSLSSQELFSQSAHNLGLPLCKNFLSFFESRQSPPSAPSNRA
jgi:hypothetical protein